jgi:flagellar basal-body rod protein FlgG
MNVSTYQLAASMINQFNRVDTITNNLANVNTNGYKQELLAEGSFNNYLARAKNDNSNLDEMNKLVNTIPKIDQKFINTTPGELQMTASPLDFALSQPDTFFKVQTPSGDIEYTRNGAFKNLNGFLVDGNGNNILNVDNEPILVEDGFAAQIGVVKTNYANVEKIGANNYKIVNLAQAEFLDNNINQIHQGAIEKSNVSAVKAMVELIDAQRRLEQAQKSQTSKSELNQKLLDKVGGNR